jgi:catechol 2,3-dioxygenase-like lactoylglutathione lyase family enzyme
VARTAMILILAVGVSTASAAEGAKAPVFFAISVPDLDASVQWYTETLGLTATVLPPGPQAKVAIVRGPGLLVELIQPAKGFGGPTRPRSPRERHFERGFTKVGFHVEDLDATVARLKKKGANVMGSVYSDQATGVRSIVVLDNDENLIQLFEPIPK